MSLVNPLLNAMDPKRGLIDHHSQQNQPGDIIQQEASFFNSMGSQQSEDVQAEQTLADFDAFASMQDPADAKQKPHAHQERKIKNLIMDIGAKNMNLENDLNGIIHGTDKISKIQAILNYLNSKEQSLHDTYK